MHGNDISFYDLIGFVGVAFYISGYTLIQLGLLRSNTILFSLNNLVAASLVLISLYHAFNFASAVIQVTYICLSTLGIFRLGFIYYKRRLDPHESEIAAKILPGIRQEDAHALMRLGEFQDVEEGTFLAVRGKPVEALAYIVSGSAHVFNDGELIAKVGVGNFIGEITCHSAEPATATVMLASPARLFVLNADALRRFMTKNPLLKNALDCSMAEDLRAKLKADTGLRNPANRQSGPPRVAA